MTDVKVSARGNVPAKTTGVRRAAKPVVATNGTAISTSTQAPVIVETTVAYGSLQNEDGGTLTFRATRDAK